MRMEKCGCGRRENDDMPPLYQQWHELLEAWDVDRTKAEQWFDEVRKAYAGPGRFYHTLDHVQAVLGMVDSLASFAENSNAVKLAAWLHDVICDSKASDNEDRSADYAEQLCKELAIPEGHRVAALIRMTMPVTTLTPRCCSTPISPSWVPTSQGIRLMQRTFGVSTPGCPNRDTEREGGKSYRDS
jgi:hypothetical protein